jgi:hypothetical protein
MARRAWASCLRYQKGDDTGCRRQSYMVMRALGYLIFSAQGPPLLRRPALDGVWHGR